MDSVYRGGGDIHFFSTAFCAHTLPSVLRRIAESPSVSKATMNPDKQPTEFMGQIPRKKKPPPADFGSSLAQAAPPAAAPISMNNISIPRKKKPKSLHLHGAVDEDRMSSSGRGTSNRPQSQPPHQRGRIGGNNSSRGHHESSSHRERHRKHQHELPSREDAGGSASSNVDRNAMPIGNKRIRIISEDPFIVRIRTKSIPFVTSAAKRRSESSVAASGNNSEVNHSASKRQRPTAVSYKELEDTDEDDLMTEAEEKELLLKRAKKRRRKMEKTKDASNSDADAATTDAFLVVQQPPPEVASALYPGPAAAIDPNAIEAPPPGVLSTLWYSREIFLHIFVLDKICGWKTRAKLELVEDGASPAPKPDAENGDDADAKPASKPTPLLRVTEATQLQQKALSSQEIWSDTKKRMEISRINAVTCPTILKMAAEESQKQTSPDKKRLKVQPVAPVAPVLDDTKATREEVVLVKWRGRSYMHCSWERASDIQRLDPSTSNIARNKLRKFYQSQEALYGPNWKQVLEEQRMTAAAIHSHGTTGHADKTSPSRTITISELSEDQDDEYFSSQYLEIERILACDENEMNMDVLSNQRALNIRDELSDIDRTERELIEQDRDSQEQSTDAPGGVIVNGDESEMSESQSWDPEDNVRYVVKWKGLPYAEITWEYWRDIKRSAVDEAEDFWYRQRPPDLEEVRRLASRPHPHMRDFKKLQESPAFGISTKPRPVAKLGADGEDSLPTNDPDPGFRLRSYQLEGVNWLLFNWWNRRSCILADEMGLGYVPCCYIFFEKPLIVCLSHFLFTP